MSQANLFGEPERLPERSQWWTPAWLAARLSAWVPQGALVLDPGCGGGSLLVALLHSGHAPEMLSGYDSDPRWVDACHQRWPRMRLECRDFLAFPSPLSEPDMVDVVVTNPPFENEGHLRFVLRALELARVVVGVFPVSFEFGRRRDRELWATRGVVTRRARMPERVDYGGDQSPSFDSVALQIERRAQPRAAGEVTNVQEETWTNG